MTPRSLPRKSNTAINFGLGDYIIVALSLSEVREIFEKALARNVLVQFNDSDQAIVVNPHQFHTLSKVAPNA